MINIQYWILNNIVTKFEESSLRRKLTLLHAYLYPLYVYHRLWSRMANRFVESSDEKVYSVFHAKSPLHHYLISHGERRGGACTRRRGGREWWRIYVMKRSPGWSRAWDARTHVPLPSRRETLAKVERTKRDKREQESLSWSSRTTCSSGVVVLVGSPRAELTAPEIWSNVHALGRIIRMGEKRARTFYHPQSLAKTCLSRDLRAPSGHRPRDATRQNIWDGFAPGVKGTNRRSFRETSSAFVFARSSEITFPFWRDIDFLCWKLAESPKILFNYVFIPLKFLI